MAHTQALPLDAAPRSALEAADWLLQIAGICRKAGLANVAQRLVAVGGWANGLAQLDHEVLTLTHTVAALAPVAVADPRPDRRLDPPLDPSGPENALPVLRALRKFPDGAKLSDLLEATGLSKSSVLYALEWLIRARKAVKTGHARGTRYGRVKERL